MYSRMEKYHNKKPNKKDTSQMDDHIPTEEEIDDHPHTFRIILIIIIFFIFICYLITVITGPSDRTSTGSFKSASSTDDTSSLVESSSKKTSQNQDDQDDVQTDQNNDQQDTNDTNENQNQGTFDDHFFSNLQTAQAYGQRCIQQGKCTNFKVINNDGQYQVQLIN